ncbi:MAG: hypothetical protein NTW38_06880 [Candidatus Aminicenantes bacterium]|nr:hypothetical protein [Candidatus Aminicenantes bacterium]
MATRKSIRLCLLAAFLAIISGLVFGVSSALAQDNAFQAAAQGLKLFLNAIPEGREPALGFGDRAEFDLAYLGNPYEMYTIHPDRLASAEGSGDKIILSLKQFRFPILCNGKIRALLNVAEVNSEMEAVGIGAANLASAIERIENSIPSSGGFSRRILLRLYQLRIDFIGYFQEGQSLEKGLFIPLPSALALIGAEPEEIIFYSYPQMLNLVRGKFAELPESLKGDYKNGEER